MMTLLSAVLTLYSVQQIECFNAGILSVKRLQPPINSSTASQNGAINFGENLAFLSSPNLR